MQPQLPARITPALQRLAEELVPNGTPVFVPIRPAPGAKAADCFPVVADHVATAGGAVQYGWRFWELPGVFVEAEFHAVWRAPEGELIDLTPLPMAVDRILFVPDPTRAYDGRQVNNVRRALTTNPAIDDFFKACDDGFELMNRGDRADQHGTIALKGAEKEEWVSIEMRKAQALMSIMMSPPVAATASKPGRNDPCPCGSGRKYKKCHLQ